MWKNLSALLLCLLVTTQALALGGTSGTGSGTSLIAGGAGGVTSFTGDGVITNNSGSTGAVTVTRPNAAANTVYGNPTAGMAAPSFTGAPVVVSYGLANTTTGAPAAGFTGIHQLAANQLQLTTTGTDVLTVTSTGSVGIGTTSPASNLDIEATSTAPFAPLTVNSANVNGTGFVLNNSTAGAHNFQFFVSGSSNSPGYSGITDTTSNYLLLGFSGGTKTVDMPALGIFGWTSTTGIASAIDTGLSRDSAGVIDVGTGAQGNSGGTLKMAALNVSGATVNMPGLGTSSAATTGTVCWTTGTGLLNVDTTTTCLLSSLRFKKDIEPLDAGLDEVMKMKPVSFLYKDVRGDENLKKRKVGMIAEDVDLIDSRIVSYEQDGKTPRSIMYAEYTAILTKAIQEQQAEISAINGAFPFHKCFLNLLMCPD